MSARRQPGRPRKARPKLGDPITPEMSQRDVAIALGVSRQELARWLWMAKLPEKEVEAYFAALPKDKIPSSRELELLARRHAGNAALERERRCPHCGALLWFEGMSAALVEPAGRA
jgi:hypothetical protein